MVRDLLGELGDGGTWCFEGTGRGGKEEGGWDDCYQLAVSKTNTPIESVIN